MPHRKAALGHKVVISAPFGRDAESVAGLLRREGYDAVVSSDLSEIAAMLDDHVGAVVLTEEALGADRRRLHAALQAQPAWSDVPFVVLAARRMGPLPPGQMVPRMSSARAAGSPFISLHHPPRRHRHPAVLDHHGRIPLNARPLACGQKYKAPDAP